VYVLAFTGGLNQTTSGGPGWNRLRQNRHLGYGSFRRSLDSPAANAAFAKQIGRHLPAPQRHESQNAQDYGILKGYNVQDETYEWALRANIVIDKQGVIQLIDEATAPLIPTPP